MTRDVLPYLLPQEGAVEFRGWLLEGLEGPTTLPEVIEWWDPDTDISMSRTVSVDMEKVLAGTGLTEDAEMSITVSWTSSSTGMTSAAWSKRVQSGGLHRVDLVLPSKQIGGVLSIRSTLALTKPMSVARRGVAGVVGSILAEDLWRVSLEGTAARFPIAMTDFAGTNYGTESSWALQTSLELDAPFMGSYLLMVNKRDTELAKAIGRGGKAPRDVFLIDQLELEVATLFIELGLERREELEFVENWPPESVGEVLSRWLKSPGASNLHPPTDAGELSEYRSRITSVAREAGFGRLLR
ncbi:MULTISPECIES: hypothetical protein [Cryobacterium]|uniref:hypothetical protein n=1 Tax=Cryobacterium TaxID=69578 RepID=UPI000CD48C6E|nr:MULTISPECIES: hypothetical protein [Cryobacterium]POH69952.1 hypothetical protein C3B60_02195 [Cryobacterium zongtaii]TFC42963.1 hypothetical protein E3O57_14655 [Cryobacterium sp. TMN-39-2]